MSDFKNIAEADGVLRSVEMQAQRMSQVEDGLERGYAHLGWMLLEVNEMKYWRVHHSSFRDYLKKVSMVSKRSQAQLQMYFLAVRDLSDTFSCQQLEDMGITKALRVRAARDYALVLPQAIVKAALDTTLTVKELKKVISTTLKLPQDDDGDWLDLEMEFIVTPEQREFAEKVIDVAMHTEPLTKTTISKSAQMWDVFEKLGMEFLSAHSGDGQ